MDAIYVIVRRDDEALIQNIWDTGEDEPFITRTSDYELAARWCWECGVIAYQGLPDDIRDDYIGGVPSSPPKDGWIYLCRGCGK